MRRISSFDPKDCNIAVAQQAKYYIENYSMSQIRDVSAGAATFYGWVSITLAHLCETHTFIHCYRSIQIFKLKNIRIFSCFSTKKKKKKKYKKKPQKKQTNKKHCENSLETSRGGFVIN